ncbi:MAG: hypothetical protein J6T94_01770 [Bacteroidaceae bacterium]|nr:hypothetical protein [Bacteroidaceae bacterium]
MKKGSGEALFCKSDFSFFISRYEEGKKIFSFSKKNYEERKIAFGQSKLHRPFFIVNARHYNKERSLTSCST